MKAFGPFSAGAVNTDIFPAFDVSIYVEAIVHITGTWAGTITFQGSNDQAAWVSIPARSATDVNGSLSSTTTGNGMFRIPLGFKFLRIRMTSYTSGTAVGVTMAAHASRGGDSVALSTSGNSIQGTAAHDAAASGNPFTIAVNGRSTLYTAVGDNDAARAMGDVNGRLVTLSGAPAQLQDRNRTVITTTTETTHVAAVSSVRHHIQNMVLANLNNANSVQVDIRDTTGGTIRATFNIPAGQTVVFSPGAWSASGTNANITAQLTGTSPNVAISTISFRSNY